MAEHWRVVMAGVQHGGVLRAYDRQIWEQIWEQNAAKPPQISAT
jgi:hypothetical protein